MHRPIAETLPLAFLLAMAAETSSNGLPNGDGSQPLQPGSLAALATKADELFLPTGQPATKRYHPVPGEKTAQFFPNFPNFFNNFKNCFSGFWRNC
jgi:hypothetical protein